MCGWSLPLLTALRLRLGGRAATTSEPPSPPWSPRKEGSAGSADPGGTASGSTPGWLVGWLVADCCWKRGRPVEFDLLVAAGWVRPAGHLVHGCVVVGVRSSRWSVDSWSNPICVCLRLVVGSLVGSSAPTPDPCRCWRGCLAPGGLLLSGGWKVVLPRTWGLFWESHCSNC